MQLRLEQERAGGQARSRKRCETECWFERARADEGYLALAAREDADFCRPFPTAEELLGSGDPLEPAWRTADSRTLVEL